MKARVRRAADLMRRSPTSSLTAATRSVPASLGEPKCRRLLMAEFRRTQQALCRTDLVVAVCHDRDLVARDLVIAFVAKRSRLPAMPELSIVVQAKLRHEAPYDRAG